MSDSVQIALIVSAAPTIVALISLFKIEKVHKATNSMKDDLVAAARKEGYEAGHKAGMLEEQQKGK